MLGPFRGVVLFPDSSRGHISFARASTYELRAPKFLLVCVVLCTSVAWVYVCVSLAAIRKQPLVIFSAFCSHLQCDA